MNLQIQCQQPLPNLQVTGQSTWQLHILSCHPWSKRSYRSLLKAQMVRLMCFPLVWHGLELDLHRNLALEGGKNIVKSEKLVVNHSQVFTLKRSQLGRVTIIWFWPFSICNGRNFSEYLSKTINTTNFVVVVNPTVIVMILNLRPRRPSRNFGLCATWSWEPHDCDYEM